MFQAATMRFCPVFCCCWILSFSLPAQTFTSSNLPLVLLETGGKPITFDRIEAQMRIIDNPDGIPNGPGDAPAYSGPVSIRLRGNYSSGLPQKPYAIETKDEAGDDLSVSLLGMPKEEDWILLATWNDKSFVRNTLMFDLARRSGQWAPRTRHVEVLLNGQYQGIYVFCEKIKRDGDRLDIEKIGPDDNTLPKLGGGYIFKHDYGWDFITDNWQPKFCSDRRLNFEWVYPDAEDITPAQRDYLSGYVDHMEKALFSPDFADSLSGYRAWIDASSWVDYFLFSEFSGNVDAYKKSMFFHKDRDGLLKMGPIWDFDWALKHLQENTFQFGSGWLFTVDPCTQDILYVPYFQRLMEDTLYQRQVCNRWAEWRGSILDTTFIFHYIDSTAFALDAAQKRHFQRWQCLGYDSGAPEVPPYPSTYAGEVEKLKQFIRFRLAWMDARMPTIACGKKPGGNTGSSSWSVAVLPNISNGDFNIQVKGLPAGGLTARVFDAGGRRCTDLALSNADTPLDLNGYPAGMYFVYVSGADTHKTLPVFVR